MISISFRVFTCCLLVSSLGCGNSPQADRTDRAGTNPTDTKPMDALPADQTPKFSEMKKIKIGDDRFAKSSDHDGSAPAKSGLEIDQRILEYFPDLPTPKAPSKPISLRYSFDDGTTLKYRITARNHMDAMGLKNSETKDVTLQYTFAAQDQGDSRPVECRYLRGSIELKSPAGGYKLDSENPEAKYATDIFAQIVPVLETAFNTAARFRTNERGRVIDFETPKEVQAAFDEQPGLRGLGMTPESLSADYLSMLTELPEQPVSSGEKWLPQTVNTVYGGDAERSGTFLGVVHDRGESLGMLQVTTKITGKPAESPIFVGMDVVGIVVILFDLERGIIVREFGRSIGQIELNINGAMMQQTIDGKFQAELIEN